MYGRTLVAMTQKKNFCHSYSWEHNGTDLPLIIILLYWKILPPSQLHTSAVMGSIPITH